MLHCKIYRAPKSYKPPEGQKSTRGGCEGKKGRGAFPYLLVIFISLFIVFANSSHNSLMLCLVSRNEVNPKLNLQKEMWFWFWLIQRKHHS